MPGFFVSNLAILHGIVGVLGFAALAAGLLALYTRRFVRRAERDYPPQGSMIGTAGGGLHVVERGSGPPVVFLHGAFGGLQDFTATVMEQAAERYRCIAIDRPGHGYSPPLQNSAALPSDQARAIRETLRKMGVSRPLLAGFSWGGSVALSYGLAYPGETAGLVLLNGVYFPWREPVSRLYGALGLPLLGPLLAHTIIAPLGQPLAGISVRRAFHPHPVAEAFSQSPVRLALRPQQFLNEAREIHTLKDFLTGQRKHYGSLEAPTVIVAGEQDIIVNSSQGQRLQQAIPNGELMLLPQAGHHVLYSHPREVLAAIDRAWALAGHNTGCEVE